MVAEAFAWFGDRTRCFLRIAANYMAACLILIVQFFSVYRLLVVKSGWRRLKGLQQPVINFIIDWTFRHIAFLSVCVLVPLSRDYRQIVLIVQYISLNDCLKFLPVFSSTILENFRKWDRIDPGPPCPLHSRSQTMACSVTYSWTPTNPRSSYSAPQPTCSPLPLWKLLISPAVRYLWSVL